MTNQNWLDYKLYMKAEFNYIRFQVKRMHPAHDFFEFLTPFLDKQPAGVHVHGTINYLLNSDGSVDHIIYLSKHANKVIKALAGPYSHALLTAHYARIKNGNGIKERDQQSKDDL